MLILVPISPSFLPAYLCSLVNSPAPISSPIFSSPRLFFSPASLFFSLLFLSLPLPRKTPKAQKIVGKTARISIEPEPDNSPERFKGYGDWFFDVIREPETAIYTSPGEFTCLVIAQNMTNGAQLRPALVLTGSVSVVTATPSEISR